MKTCIINQFRGVGDILFVIPIARYYMSLGYRVLFPTLFPELNKHFPDIFFINKNFVNIDYEMNTIVEINGTLILPLRYSDQITRTSYKNCMAAKYRMLNLPPNMWRNLYWKRDRIAENKLFYDVLKLDLDTKYNLINTTFLSDFSGKIDIKVENDYRNVHMSTKEGFTLLDWCLVMENAETIHTVSTSILYVLELLPLKNEELHIYKRGKFEDTHDYYNYLMTKDYILH